MIWVRSSFNYFIDTPDPLQATFSKVVNYCRWSRVSLLPRVVCVILNYLHCAAILVFCLDDPDRFGLIFSPGFHTWLAKARKWMCTPSFSTPSLSAFCAPPQSSYGSRESCKLPADKDGAHRMHYGAFWGTTKSTHFAVQILRRLCGGQMCYGEIIWHCQELVAPVRDHGNVGWSEPLLSV